MIIRPAEATDLDLLLSLPNEASVRLHRKEGFTFGGPAVFTNQISA